MLYICVQKGGREFEKENPSIKVQGVYDSSGKLQIQIEQGLKSDVFFSAATKQMDALVDEKYILFIDVFFIN